MYIQAPGAACHTHGQVHTWPGTSDGGGAAGRPQRSKHCQLSHGTWPTASEAAPRNRQKEAHIHYANYIVCIMWQYSSESFQHAIQCRKLQDATQCISRSCIRNIKNAATTKACWYGAHCQLLTVVWSRTGPLVVHMPGSVTASTL